MALDFQRGRVTLNEDTMVMVVRGDFPRFIASLSTLLCVCLLYFLFSLYFYIFFFPCDRF